MAPRVRLRGVFKFRSLAEAQDARLSSRSAPVRSDQDAETIG